MTDNRAQRPEEERRAIVQTIDLRVQSGGMTHREATRVEGISDALVHSWRRKFQGPSTSAHAKRMTRKKAAEVAAPVAPPPTRGPRDPDSTLCALPVPEGEVPDICALVRALNSGGKAVLRSYGGGWELAIG